ncbi:mannose-1-phosphate guanylyltransferase [Oceaniglobus ichthyenteri]|uniref:mannose-1-phosphate guanylyltransferase n=1 Tax=Oceaniglobus ichthyenteri TaxID=2136177 RepID=UPI000D390BCE|nr:sugar phosphate nucleotidyltransferase [Oceaniglobus ichthyenteri]
MTNIHPLIICGGNGTRLWPMSRTQSPKQFQRIGDENSHTFFQSAVERHCGEGFEPPVIVSSVRHRNTVTSQLREIDSPAQFIYEPMGRNTGPAVLAAALHLYAQNPKALMLVIPADHVIEGDINTTILAMRDAAEAGYVVTFGIKPRYAETGFGYITDGGPIAGFDGLHSVHRFVEKPPLRKAKLLVESEIAYWASGISMFAAATIIEEYQKFDPDSFIAVQQALAHATSNARGTLLNPDHFRHAADLPTEQVVFEKTKKIALAPLHVDWSDVGSWSAMYGISKPNHDGNVLQGDVIAVETKNSMVRSDTRLVSVVGMSDVIIIDTPDALLVTKVGHCQNVKKVANHLKAAHRQEAEKHNGSTAEWGNYKTLVDKNGLNMSSVMFKAGAVLDIDPATLREITVVAGTLMISNGKTQTILTEGERALLDSKVISRLSNRTDEPVEMLIMTQSGDLGLIDSLAVVPAGAAPEPQRPDAPARTLAHETVHNVRPA